MLIKSGSSFSLRTLNDVKRHYIQKNKSTKEGQYRENSYYFLIKYSLFIKLSDNLLHLTKIKCLNICSKNDLYASDMQN